MIKITLEDKLSLKPLNKNWWGSAKGEWAPILLEENKPFWEAQTDSYRRPWVPLDSDTKDLDGFLLKETGEMFNTAVVRPWGNKFIVDTTTYGIVHQLGTKKIPARPWMGVPDSAVDKIPPIAWKHILK